METKKCQTFTATIYVGRKDLQTGRDVNTIPFYSYLRECCDKRGLCVSVVDVEYIYTNGAERGYAITLINYPRFPKLLQEIKDAAIALATDLRKIMRQRRVSVVCTDETITIGEF